MKVKKLHDELSAVIGFGGGNLEARIVLEEPSIGAMATVGVKSVHMGFDFDSGSLLICTDKPVIIGSRRISND